MQESHVITYSSAQLAVLTSACSLRCAYCGFYSDTPTLPDIQRVRRSLLAALHDHKTEIVFSAGTLPEQHQHVSEALLRQGFSSFTDFLLGACTMALTMNILPTLNVGVLSPDTLAELRPVIAAYTLFLETTDVELAAHIQPNKNPYNTIASLQAAGELSLPVNTGIMLGMGESHIQRCRTLYALAELHNTYNNIQLLTLQPYLPNKRSWLPSVQLTPYDIERTIYYAQQVMPSVTLQIPHTSLPFWQDFLTMGIGDIGTLRFDMQAKRLLPRSESIESLENFLATHDIFLAERLALMQHYINKKWCSEAIYSVAQRHYIIQQDFRINTLQPSLFGEVL